MFSYKWNRCDFVFSRLLILMLLHHTLCGVRDDDDQVFGDWSLNRTSDRYEVMLYLLLSTLVSGSIGSDIKYATRASLYASDICSVLMSSHKRPWLRYWNCFYKLQSWSWSRFWSLQMNRGRWSGRFPSSSNMLVVVAYVSFPRLWFGSIVDGRLPCNM